MDSKHLPAYDQGLLRDVSELGKAIDSIGQIVLDVLEISTDEESARVFAERLLYMRELVRVYRQQGAHPFFIQEAIKLSLEKDSQSSRQQIMEAITKDLQKNFLERQQVPGFSELSFVPRLCSRLYDNGSPIEVDQGIVNGAIVELEAQVMFMASSRGSNLIQEAYGVWIEAKADVFTLVLDHPIAGIVTLGTLLRASFSLDNNVNATSIPVQQTPEAVQSIHFFLRDRVLHLGIQEVINQMLETWSDSNPITWEIFWYLIKELQLLQRPWATQVLQALLTIKEGQNSQQKYAALQMLRFSCLTTRDPSWVCAAGSDVLVALIQALKEELPENPEAGDALRSWMASTKISIRMRIIFLLTMKRSSGLLEQVGDTRIQPFLEEVFGPEAWDIICEAWSKRVQEIQSGDGTRNIKTDEEASEYQNMRRVIRDVSWPARPHVQQQKKPRNIAQEDRLRQKQRNDEWSTYIGQIESLLRRVPERQTRSFQERLDKLRAQARLRPNLARRLLQEIQDAILPVTAKKPPTSPVRIQTHETPKDDTGSQDESHETPLVRIPPSLIPKGMKYRDLMERLGSNGWQRTRGRNSSHHGFTKADRKFVMTYNSKRTLTANRFTLADALSKALFTIEEVKELFQ